MSKQPKRLLILSCSARKTDAELCRAIDRYQGPSFFVVRRWISQNDAANTVVWILSAKYGLISSDKLITTYDRVMTPERSAELKNKIRKQFYAMHCYFFRKALPESVFCHLPKNYREAAAEHLSENYAGRINFAAGTFGEKLRQLKDWLERNNDNQHIRN